MRIWNSLSIALGKSSAIPIKLLKLGSGSTWPGQIVLPFNKNFIRNALSQNPHLKKILIAGTNGKTTTTTLFRFLLTQNGLKVFQNQEGANLLNGIASNIIKNSNLSGKIDFNAAIFEVDESTLPAAIEQVDPDAVLILNLFRDQLDRYGEVDIIARKWRKSLKTLSKNTKVYLNADDPQVSYLGDDLNAQVITFGLAQKFLTTKEVSHDVDSIYCPKCGNKLTYSGISYSHLGNFSCSKCGLKRVVTELITEEIKTPLEGIYNLYNSFATIKVVNKVFGISEDKLRNQVRKFKAPFGRQEVIEINSKKAYLILSKNPTGFNQSIGVISKKINKNKDGLLIILNDRVPDGHDVSWIWDVDFEKLKEIGKIMIGGDRAYDMALRLHYSGFKLNQIEVGEDLEGIVEKSIKKIAVGGTLFVLPTYSGMLEVRKILSGRKLL